MSEADLARVAAVVRSLQRQGPLPSAQRPWLCPIAHGRAHFICGGGGSVDRLEWMGYNGRRWIESNKSQPDGDHFMVGKCAMNSPSPRRPSQLPDYSEACLQALVDRGLAQQVSLGGGLGLLHYLDYRQTLDVDAWWAEGASAEDRRLVTETLVSALQPHGQVKTRAWGDVVSIELLQAGRKVFSFQIAQRSAQLQPSSAAPWIAVPLDSFPDLVASKMVALVERGAPRDFRDIYAVCTAGLLTPDGCWRLWRQRQALAGSDTDLQRARLAITTHLARIVQHRRLDQVADPLAREQAAQIRIWFMDTFLGGNDDSNQLD